MGRPRDATKREQVAGLLRQGKSARAIMAALHCGSRMVAEVRRNILPPATVTQIAASIRQIQADIAEMKGGWRPAPVTLAPPPSGVPLPPPPPGMRKLPPPPAGKDPREVAVINEMRAAFAAGAVKPSLVAAHQGWQ